MSSASRRTTARATTVALMEAARRARTCPCSRCPSRARRSTTCSCITPDANCATRCRRRRRRERLHDPEASRQSHAPHLGHHRTRPAPLPAQPDADDRLDDHAAGAVGGAGLRLRRQGQEPPGRRGGPGPRRAGGEAQGDVPGGASGAKTFDTVDYSDPGQALRDLRNGKHQRRADDSARLLAPRAGGRRSARRAHRGQHRQVRRRHAGRVDGRLVPATTSRRSRRGGCPARRRSPWSRCILTCPYIQYLLPGTIVLAIFVLGDDRREGSSSSTTRRAGCTRGIWSRRSRSSN